MKYPFLLAGLALSLSVLTANGAVLIDFENSSDFANNFRAGSGTQPTNTNFGAPNDYLNSSGATVSFFYDANGAAAGISSFAVSSGNPLTLTFDISAVSHNTSFGIYIQNAGTTNSYLALLNVNTGNDQLRFANGLVNANIGAAGTLIAGSHANNTDFITTEGTVLGNTASFTYSIDGLNQPMLSYTVNGTTSNYTLAGFTAFTNVEVGFRANTPLKVDNLSIAVVPEPSTWLLMLGGSVLLFALRRRSLKSDTPKS